MKKVFIPVICAVVIAAVVISASLIVNALPYEPCHPAPKKDAVRVACVGDSITFGSFLKNRIGTNYPKQLANLLGEKYCVRNYGYSGCCVQNTADHPYRKNSIYKEMQDFHPDIIIFMLGTNDTKAFNWKGDAAFKKEYEGFIEELMKIPGDPEIYILTSPSNFGKANTVNFEIRKDYTQSVVKLQREVADEYSLKLIDLNSFTAGKPQLFHDGVHPNANGAQKIAEYIYNNLS